MSLEAGSSAVRRPPPRPTLPTTRHVSLMLQPLPQSQPDGGSTPQDGRRDPRSHQRHTGRDRPLCPTTVSTISTIPAGKGRDGDYRPLCPTTMSTISTIPAGKGYDGDYRPLCPNAVPMIGRPLKGSALYTEASAILGFVPAETPPSQCQPRHRPSLGIAHNPSTVACTFAAASTPRHSRGSHDAQDLMG